ncbi:MAG TPA: TIGR03936 family radical SAM-associated protein [Anaerolineae bacterium]|nr:TIGR03936 family radical SAM-associated protein [Anaerolineae bacterium]HQI85303.1 TIGR03936 family radical SAM-associated protein [Anaerolineae bacterium]
MNCELEVTDPQLPATSYPPLRYRIMFATRRTLAYVSVLELGKVWERSLRRAGMPLKYSQGYNPRPKLHFAAPLPVGCGCEADLLDVWLESPVAPEVMLAALANALPPDLSVSDIHNVPEDEPALSEQLIAAEYRVWLRDVTPDAVQSAVADFLDSATLSLAKRGRKYRGKTYDLRPLVEELHCEDAPSPWLGLWMRLHARPRATGRPDEVLKALGLSDVPRRCTRTRLILDLLIEDLES